MFSRIFSTRMTGARISTGRTFRIRFYRFPLLPSVNCYYGALKKLWGVERVTALEARLAAVVVIPYDVDVCRAYARLKCEAKTAAGTDRVVGSNDLWVASCAIRHGLPLVSNNRKHFEGLPGLRPISQDLSSH
jgi:predicted nucleic acid-binding protein